MKASSIEDVAYRIDTYWMPELTKRSLALGDEPQSIWQEISFLETMARNLEISKAADADGQPVTLPAKALAARARFRAAIAARQSKVFPILRKQYVDALAARLWRSNIEAHANGRQIKFVGALFASNANIEDAEQLVDTNIKQLRFSLSDYRWCNGCGGAHYTLSTPSDQAVGYWEKDAFKVVN